jgi:hypothetical protein
LNVGALEGFFGKRAKITTSEQEICQEVALCKNHAQNGRAKCWPTVIVAKEKISYARCARFALIGRRKDDGYARVSTDGQSLDHQQSALANAGAEKIFAERVSGAVTDRKALARAIAELGPGTSSCNAAG